MRHVDQVTPRAVLLPIALICTVALGHAACQDGPRARPTAIVLIVIDALRADHLGTYGYHRPTSPHIDEWATRGMVHERAYATSPWTLPSFGSILTGLLPSGHGAGAEAADADPQTQEAASRHFVTLARGTRTLGEALQAQGFATGAFVANPFLDPRFGLGRGFDDYDHQEASNSTLRRANEVVDSTLEWIDDKADRPFFVLVHLFDPHLDYDAPAPFRGRFTTADGEHLQHPVEGLWPIRNRVPQLSEQERAFIVGAYDEEIAFVDTQVDRLLTGIEARGLWNRSLVVLTSDHGEELFDHGGFEHGHAMHEEVLRVPLILWASNLEPGRASVPVSLIDLAPTILDATGVEPAAPLPGISLLDRDDSRANRPIVAERLLYGPDTRVIVEWPMKAIARADREDAQLFDLAEDPGERHDLQSDRPARLRQMLATLSDSLSEARARQASTEIELDEDLSDRLRSLGYIR